MPTDTNRLDWLQRQSGTIVSIRAGMDGLCHVLPQHKRIQKETTLRKAIDAAMKEDKATG